MVQNKLNKEELTNLKRQKLELLKQKERSLMRQKCLTDLKYLFEEVLGYDKLDDFHLEIESTLKQIRVSKDKKGLFLIPRGHWKSTLITITYVIQRILENPDITIFISNATLSNAKKFLSEIKGHFEKNQKLIELFGIFVSKEKWGEEEIIIAQRQKIQKEPTIRVGSVDHSVVSSHFDLIVLDDLVNRENTNTKEQCDKVIQYYKDVLDLGKAGETEFIVIGTCWNYADIYQHIQESNKKLNNFLILKKTCFKDQAETIPLFYRFSKEHLDSLKAEKGTYEFACQYKNEIIDNENAVFKLSWMENEYTEEELRKKYYLTFGVLDMAKSLNLDADFTGCVIVSLDNQWNWYIRYAKRFKLDIKKRVDLIFGLWENFRNENLIMIGVEEKAFQDNLKVMLDEEMRRRNIWPIVEELKDHKRNKEARIRAALAGRLESRRIYFLKDAKDDQNLLKDELLKFPLAQHDDLCLVGNTKIATIFGDKMVKDIKKGDIILTPLGLQKVLVSKQTGIKRVILNRGLRGTINHPVFSKGKGFKNLGDLGYNDKISILNLKEQILWRYKKLLFLMESNTNGWAGKESIILVNQQPIKGEKILKDCMWRFGNFIIKRQFQKALKFIIKTAILLTTTSAIWSVYQLSNIIKKLGQKVQQSIKQKLWRIYYLKPSQKLLYGTRAMLDGLGILLKPENNGKIQKWQVCPALNVKQNLKAQWAMLNSVDKIVKCEVGEKEIQRNGGLLGRQDWQEVYNLTVANDHCFYANGVLVGNCDALAYIEDIAYKPEGEKEEGVLSNAEIRFNQKMKQQENRIVLNY